ncbi:MAG: hypothetical protein K8R89_05305 [Anaerolineae bacterium]|nr:hypothetical protein [Anaerolineae bacterium]
MTVYLEKITVRFPGTNIEFTNRLAALINVLGHNENHILRLTNSNQIFYPELLLDFRSGYSEIVTDFTLSNGESVCVKDLAIMTGIGTLLVSGVFFNNSGYY